MTTISRSEFSKRLSTIGNKENLSLFSLFVVLLLDIFLFSLIATGMNSYNGFLESPDEFMNYDCYTVITTLTEPEFKDNSLLNFLDSKSNEFPEIDPNGIAKPYYTKDVSIIQSNAGTCVDIRNYTEKIRNNPIFQEYFAQLKNDNERIASKQTIIKTIQSQYDSTLLEKISNQPEDQSITTSNAGTSKQDINKAQQLIDSIKANIENRTQSIIQNSDYQSLRQSIISSSSDLEMYDQKTYRYPVRTFFLQILFLIPLFLATNYRNKKALKSESYIQVLISTHVLGILGIFGLWKIFGLIYDIIPHKLLEDLIQWFIDSGVLSVLYYLGIAVAILVAMGFIYIIQKKIFSPEKQILHRLVKGLCIDCGKALGKNEDYCKYCGSVQITACTSCGHKIRLGSSFCTDCGSAQSHIGTK